MADLKFVDQHNMVAYLEKSNKNAEFHQIANFLSTCSINYALTAVVISESLERSDLLFNDEDGATCLTNDEIFENLALMGYEQLSTKLTFQKAPEGEGSAIHPEPQPTPSTSQPNVSELQIASLHIETSPTTTPQTEAHQTAVSQIVFHKAFIEQILPSPTTYQRKKKTQKCRRTKKDIELPQTSVPLDHGADEDSDNIFKTQSTAMLNVDIPQGIDTGGSPRRQETMGGTPAQTRSERVLEQPNEPPLSESHTSGSGEGMMEQTFELTDNVPSTPNDSPLTGGYIPGSDEGRMKLDELITLCTKLSKQVLDLEKEKDDQAVEILYLKKRVKKLERKRKSSISHPRRKKYRQVETFSNDGLDEEDASKQGRRSDKIKPMFTDKDFEELDDHKENVEEETFDAATSRVSTAAVTISTAKPRTPPSSTSVFDDEDVTMAMAQTLIKMKEHKAKEKGVAITDVEDSSSTIRPVRSIITLQPLPTIDPKDKGKGVLVKEEPVKIKKKDQGDLQIQADAKLAQRLHEEESAELERRQKERVAQEEASMVALYEEYDTIQASINVDALFAASSNRKKESMINDSGKKNDSSSKPAGGSRKKTLARKRADEKKSEESAKRQKLEDVVEEQESTKSDEEAAADYEHEKKELRMWLIVVSNEEETIIRADGNTSYHKSLSNMLRKFDRQDLVDLHRLVMKSYEVYTLLMDGTLTCFNMLVEKRYPLIKEMLQKMLNWKLEAKVKSTMAFELLKFIKSQLEE
ncbi:hypothetical protein Tco_0381149 [Tanacetum coccineum]